ncbi:uncharacterized protein N7515_004759 [Penicillium bovifimosum]|uniref:Synaptobrevin n=1 Tax=Penicillium bovifimosum TaxID=126998 RepID=A0A9W9L3T4_9EURO|nr:uncharacterized protein N7515_004759 [Penicillium bovifimosum]KAJ5135481.1 hypothetical protein N7515_004759 [Penicillium bovifimosum]
MAGTAFPSESTTDLTLLNVARLFTRLEHNLLSPGPDRRALQQSEYQRMRVNKNVEYARTLLTQLERSLPQLKPLDRKHEAQAEIARDRQLLKRIQIILDEAEAKAQAKEDEDETDDGDDEWKELFSKPVAKRAPSIPQAKDQATPKQTPDSSSSQEARLTNVAPTATTGPSATPTTSSSPSKTPGPPTLRNRHKTSALPASSETATATGSSAKLSGTEAELTTQRLEQEDLTSSLLTLASQLKSSSQSFQSTLENEKSALDRAVSGIDRTSSTMEAAGKRMGMLRKMTEGKGLWGRMMLYAWIFGLWVVAILIVYVGPKLRF